jgi:hypothetical protein
MANRLPRFWRGVVLAAVMFSITTAAVVLGGLLDREMVSSKQAQRSVDVGLPLNWLHQDQFGYDPPFPAYAGFASPLENPTNVSWADFAVNVALVFAGLVAVWLALVAVRGRSRRSTAAQIFAVRPHLEEL